MKITKINCASCGAPLNIPEDTDVIVCPSCHSTLAIERSEGYVTLKVMEKLAESIKENAYVTQVELRRMQINQLISMEEMKINTLQTEIRTVKRRMQPGPVLNGELAELLLQESDIRMHIRSLKTDIAHLDPGWEESLDVLQKDSMLVNEALKSLLPYAAIPSVQNRIDHLRSEKQKCDARYNKLESKLLRRELQSINYPSFERLTLEEMEELRERIPADLRYLKSREQTNVNLEMQREMNATLKKINDCYHLKKVESQAGKLISLDLHGPYPEEPVKLQKLIDLINTDLAKLAELTSCPEKEQFRKLLAEKAAFLTRRMEENIPEKRARKKKRRLIIALSIPAAIVICIIAAIIIGVIARRNGVSDGAVDQVQSFISSNLGEVGSSSTVSGRDQEGQYEEYYNLYVEVTASVTYLRDAPSTDANSVSKAVQGDILLNIHDETLSDQWYKVSTLDGSITGYLAVDWVAPITVYSIPGTPLSSELNSSFYTFDFSLENNDWPKEDYDDDFARGSSTYESGSYLADITSNDDFIYSYTNQKIDALPENYLFTLTMEAIELSDTAYYGIQTNVIDGSNFDAVLISSEGTLYVLRVRNGYFNILYDTVVGLNTMVDVHQDSANVLSMTRSFNSAESTVMYQYAINGKVFAEVTTYDEADSSSTMGMFIYLDQLGDHATIRIDDFVVNQ